VATMRACRVTVDRRSIIQKPTGAFYGMREAGWRIMGACLADGLPVQSLRRVWDVWYANEPACPHWELVFLRRIV